MVCYNANEGQKCNTDGGIDHRGLATPLHLHLVRSCSEDDQVEDEGGLKSIVVPLLVHTASD